MNVGDKVLTSKGNFGKITSIKGSLANVKIGYKEYEIELNNLISVLNTQIINVKYIKDSTSQKIAIPVEKGTIIFDINNPDVIENYVKEKLGKDIVIKTIHL